MERGRGSHLEVVPKATGRQGEGVSRDSPRGAPLLLEIYQTFGGTLMWLAHQGVRSEASL